MLLLTAQNAIVAKTGERDENDIQVNDAEMEALEQDGMAIYCDERCSNTGEDPWGGTWCNILGKSGCRACDVFK